MKTAIAVVLGFAIMWVVFYGHTFASDPHRTDNGSYYYGDSADQSADDPGYEP